MRFREHVRMFVRGKEIPDPVDARIELFVDCQMFEFKHLPDPGGIYAQHPEVIRSFRYIMIEQQKYDKAQEAQKKRRENGPPMRAKNAGQEMGR